VSVQPAPHQLDNLIEALLDAFDHASLTQMVHSQLGIDLKEITPVAGQPNLRTVVFELVTHFARQDRGLNELLNAASAENDNNPKLESLSKVWAGFEFAAITSPPQPTASTIINTDGGTGIQGNVDVVGDYIGRDQNVQRDYVRGDVYHNYFFDQSSLNPDAPRLRPSDIPALLPYKVDRYPQIETLEDTISEIRHDPTKPIICIIHGNDQQGHKRFVERIKVETLPPLLQLPPNQDKIQETILRWPDRCHSQTELHEGLRRALSKEFLKTPTSSIEQIAAQVRLMLSKAPMIIHIGLSDRQIRNYTDAAIKDFMCFWKDWAVNSSSHHLFICLCVKYATRQGASIGKRRWSLFRTANLEKKLLNSDYTLIATPHKWLPKLENIGIEDAEHWAQDSATEYFCKEQNIESEIRKVFEAWEREEKSTTMPFDALTKNLRTLLQKYGSA